MHTSTYSPSRRFTTKAFTLIELLTVIAIIGILAAIIIPTVGKVRSLARNAQCVARLRDWGRAIHLFANDNKGKYQGNSWISAASNPYQPYFPAVRDAAGNTTGAAKYFGGCPIVNATDFSTTYAFIQPSIDGDITKVQPAPASGNRFVPLIRAANPSKFLMICDSMKGTSATVDATPTQFATFIDPLLGGPIQNAATRGDETVSNRHGGTKMNGVFGDGSVKTITGTPVGSGDTSSIYEMRAIWFQLY